jgi:hypothetical protein
MMQIQLIQPGAVGKNAAKNHSSNTPKNSKGGNNQSVNATINNQPAVFAESQIEVDRPHVYASASPNKKRVVQNMHPALLPEQ